MKEKLYTIPIMDAINAKDECPFCYLERVLEQNTIEFVLGSSYMEDDVRSETDKLGFCRKHFKQMYDYGNYLGNAWILSTHLKRVNGQLEAVINGHTSQKTSIISRLKKEKRVDNQSKTAIGSWIRNEEENCYLCNKMELVYVRYLDTFFQMLHTNSEFFELVKQSKGFCLHHFGDLVEYGEGKLSSTEKDKIFPMLFELMRDNMKRVEEDILWFIEKYDYKNHEASWKNSKDAVPRTIQKIVGGYPADPVFKNQK